METKIAIPSQNGTDKVVHNKKNGTPSEETSEMDFIDNFLSVLITNMNPSDLSLDANTSDKLSKLINNETVANEDISKIDLKQFINSLKSELANGKPHQLNLEGMKETVSNLLSGQTSSSIIQEDSLATGALLTDKGDDSTEKLLLNLRKFLTKEEFENIKNNLQPSITKKNIEVAPKVEVINRFLSVITGKELEAKSKIESKANNISLETNQSPKGNDLISILLHNSDVHIEAQSKENGNFASVKSNMVGLEQSATAEVQTISSKYVTTEKQALNIENEIKAEQSIANGNTKNEGDLPKEFTKQQNRDQQKQRIVKSDISELLTKTNTKKVELKKTENVVKSNFVEKAIKNIKMTKSGGANVARIMLNPRSLGDITLRITMIGNNVKLYIKADKSEAAEHIDRQLPLLKERMVDSGLKVEQVIIESSETDHLANNKEQNNRNEQEELRRQFVKSFGRIAAKEEFDISMNDVAYYNNNPFVGYTKAGSKVNV